MPSLCPPSPRRFPHQYDSPLLCSVTGCSDDCPSCPCGTTPNIVPDLASLCSQHDWDQVCAVSDFFFFCCCCCCLCLDVGVCLPPATQHLHHSLGLEIQPNRRSAANALQTTRAAGTLGASPAFFFCLACSAVMMLFGPGCLLLLLTNKEFPIRAQKLQRGQLQHQRLV